jgi:predicted amidohydrolase YtcJ
VADLVVTRADLGTPLLSRLRISGSLIVAVGPDLPIKAEDNVLDAAGGAVIPGLHDHHVHLYAAAAAVESLPLRPPEVHDRSTFAKALINADDALPVGAWIRGVGYHEGVAGPLDRHVLDQLVPGRPIRIQERSGSQWILNSAAIRELPDLPIGEDRVERTSAGEPTGRLIRMDRWLAMALKPSYPSLAAVSSEAARAGITGFTDATPLFESRQLDLLVAAHSSGDLLQALTVMSAPGAEIRAPAIITLGSVKIILDDDRLPSFDELCSMIVEAHDAGRSVAIHCVTRVQTVLTVAALTEVGSSGRDRIEHGAVIPDELLPGLAELGVTVVTNPGFVLERGDNYLREVDPADLPDLYRCRSLHQAGIQLAAGTDTPFGPADPWTAMRACTTRTTASGKRLGPSERLDAWMSLSLFLGCGESPGTPRSLSPGRTADLCVLFPSLTDSLRSPSADNVALCLIKGEIKFDNR